MRIPGFDRITPQIGHLGRFAAVGVTNTLVDFSVFSLLFYRFDVHIVLANSLAYGVAVTNSYLLNKYWTFAESKGTGQPIAQFLLFVALNGVGLGLSNLTVWALAGAISPLYAKGCAVGVTFVWGYWTSRRIVY